MADGVVEIPHEYLLRRCRTAMEMKRQADAAGCKQQSSMFLGQIDTLRAVWEEGTGKDNLRELAATHQ